MNKKREYQYFKTWKAIAKTRDKNTKEIFLMLYTNIVIYCDFKNYNKKLTIKLIRSIYSNLWFYFCK